MNIEPLGLLLFDSFLLENFSIVKRKKSEIKKDDFINGQMKYFIWIVSMWRDQIKIEATVDQTRARIILFYFQSISFNHGFNRG